jgi:tetratricopeptide (TPR) repeat protein
LATAGAYISQTADSFGSYLQLYESSWKDLALNSDELLEYGNHERKTLYSTWNLSLKQIEAQDPEATQLLRLMAYLSNLDLWFELFQNAAKSESKQVSSSIPVEVKGKLQRFANKMKRPISKKSGKSNKKEETEPAWLATLVNNRTRFNKAMSKLQEYSLVETSIGPRSDSYSLHTCVHDWTAECLNPQIDNSLFSLAASCIASNMMENDEPEFWIINRRLVHHVIRLEYVLLKYSADWSSVKLSDLQNIGSLNEAVGRIAQATKLYQRVLETNERARGPEDMSTIIIVNKLGNLYLDQEQISKAENMYRRALEGMEKCRGPKAISTLMIVNNLGILYEKQGRLSEAEIMYQRALDGKEKILGPGHKLTLTTVENLGMLYTKQGQIAEAETMYQRALDGLEKAWGPDHISTLRTVHSIAVFYSEQGRLAEAGAMYKRAQEGLEKSLGPEHPSTLMTLHGIGTLRANQGQVVEAETMYLRALEGYQMVRGSEHKTTLDIAYNLGGVYAQQGRVLEAETMFKRAIKGYEKVRGLEHKSTLDAVYNMGLLFATNGRILEAQLMYQRALVGYENTLGPEHQETLDCVEELRKLQDTEGKEAKDDAESGDLIRHKSKLVSQC